MIQLIALYLLAGTFVGLMLERSVRKNGDYVSGGERLWIIIMWPIMGSIFLFYFIRAFFGNE